MLHEFSQAPLVADDTGDLDGLKDFFLHFLSPPNGLELIQLQFEHVSNHIEHNSVHHLEPCVLFVLGIHLFAFLDVVLTFHLNRAHKHLLVVEDRN